MVYGKLTGLMCTSLLGACWLSVWVGVLARSMGWFVDVLS